MSAKQEQDWKFDKKKASTALQELSCHINPFRDENVAELVRVISYCMDLEKALDKACERLEVLSYVKGVGQVGMNFKEWKEWLKENA